MKRAYGRLISAVIFTVLLLGGTAMAMNSTQMLLHFMGVESGTIESGTIYATDQDSAYLTDEDGAYITVR